MASRSYLPGSSSAVLLIDREMLWRKLFAFDQDAHGGGGGVALSAAANADAMRDAVQRLVDRGRHGPLRAMLEQRIHYWVRSDIAPPFWRFFEHTVELIHDARRSKKRRHELTFFCAEQLTMAMQFAEDAFAQCVEIASVMDGTPHYQSRDEAMRGVRGIRHGETMMDQLQASFRSILFEDSEHTAIFQDVLVIFFSMSFHKFGGREKFQAFESRPIQALLLQLHWMHIAEPALLRVLHSQIHKTMEATCGDDYSERYLEQLERWATSELLPWLNDLLQTSERDAVSQRWKEILSRHVIEEFGKWRISQLFEIIKEYPESTPALEDIRACLDHTNNQHALLVESFQSVIHSRLLHPGVNTSSILDIYVSTIKAFRILDTRGVMLEALSEPIEAYLKQRSDTVRCIVTSLTDEDNGELFEELRKNNMRVIQQDDDSDDDEDISPDLWEPDPIEADPTKTSRSRNSDDILRILVNIYGSRELFVNEYRMMLADKLLQNVAYNTDQDVQTLELLKLRFGEDSLQQCETMVRDVDESKRVNQHIHKSDLERDDTVEPLVTDVTIVSSQFWPPLQSEEFVLHASVAAQIERYKEAYQTLKNRQLAFNNSLGSVQVSIELDGVERDFSVSPLQATIIQHFGDQDAWHVEALAAQLEINDELLLRHVTYWLNHSVLILSSDRKELVAAKAFTDSQLNIDGANGGDEQDTAVSTQAQADEDVRVLENYIVAMLANMGSLSIQHIHNSLSNFARSGTRPYDKTISGLSVILAKLVQKGKLEHVAGQYQLTK